MQTAGHFSPGLSHYFDAESLITGDETTHVVVPELLQREYWPRGGDKILGETAHLMRCLSACLFLLGTLCLTIAPILLYGFGERSPSAREWGIWALIPSVGVLFLLMCAWAWRRRDNPDGTQWHGQDALSQSRRGLAWHWGVAICLACSVPMLLFLTLVIDENLH